MTITIQRGAAQVGGSCIELCFSHSKILLDYGLPLDDEPESRATRSPISSQDALLPLRGIHKDDTPLFDGILLSHAHPDHHGLLGYVHPEIPVYANLETQELVPALWERYQKQASE